MLNALTKIGAAKPDDSFIIISGFTENIIYVLTPDAVLSVHHPQ